MSEQLSNIEQKDTQEGLSVKDLELSLKDKENGLGNPEVANKIAKQFEKFVLKNNSEEGDSKRDEFKAILEEFSGTIEIQNLTDSEKKYFTEMYNSIIDTTPVNERKERREKRQRTNEMMSDNDSSHLSELMSGDISEAKEQFPEDQSFAEKAADKFLMKLNEFSGSLDEEKDKKMSKYMDGLLDLPGGIGLLKLVPMIEKDINLLGSSIEAKDKNYAKIMKSTREFPGREQLQQRYSEYRMNYIKDNIKDGKKLSMKDLQGLIDADPKNAQKIDARNINFDSKDFESTGLLQLVQGILKWLGLGDYLTTYYKENYTLNERDLGLQNKIKEKYTANKKPNEGENSIDALATALNDEKDFYTFDKTVIEESIADSKIIKNKDEFLAKFKDKTLTTEERQLLLKEIIGSKNVASILVENGVKSETEWLNIVTTLFIKGRRNLDIKADAKKQAALQENKDTELREPGKINGPLGELGYKARLEKIELNQPDALSVGVTYIGDQFACIGPGHSDDIVLVKGEFYKISHKGINMSSEKLDYLKIPGIDPAVKANNFGNLMFTNRDLFDSIYHKLEIKQRLSGQTVTPENSLENDEFLKGFSAFAQSGGLDKFIVSKDPTITDTKEFFATAKVSMMEGANGENQLVFTLGDKKIVVAPQFTNESVPQSVPVDPKLQQKQKESYNVQSAQDAFASSGLGDNKLTRGLGSAVGKFADSLEESPLERTLLKLADKIPEIPLKEKRSRKRK